jgi:acyl-CoA synthetase (AMP-forming)/AMP-acid ligase II
MEFNLADLFEHAVDNWGEREYLVADGRRRTYAEMEDRANRLAHHLQAQGIGPGDHVGIYGYNSVEWVEALWAVFKLRAVWININYRYVEDELEYLFGNTDLKALIHDAEFSDRVDAVLPHLPDLEHRLVIGDQYEAALAAQHGERDFGPRSGDDLYILYTGGTTGMPKGVVWRQEDVFFALGGGIDALTNVKVTAPEDMVAKGEAMGFQITMVPIAPLMHGATQWAVMGGSFTGNRIILMAKFDPHEVWRLIDDEQANSLMITGDAMGRPLIEALREAPSKDLALASLLSVSSTAALFSPSVKDEFIARFPDAILIDAVGSSEGGANGVIKVEKGHTDMKGGPTINPLTGTIVIDDDGQPIAPGSGIVGRVARSGNIPLGYYNDPVKTAEVFVTIDGVRYAIPGDYATIEEDCTITLLGRGNQSINSGGEKIFPEEVETAIKSHPDVYDALVVGVPDERWGQRVTAVVQARAGTEPTLASIQDHCRTKIAGYKVPRGLHLVGEVQRAPSGKPDYRWAKAVATSET